LAVPPPPQHPHVNVSSRLSLQDFGRDSSSDGYVRLHSFKGNFNLTNDRKVSHKLVYGTIATGKFKGESWFTMD